MSCISLPYPPTPLTKNSSNDSTPYLESINLFNPLFNGASLCVEKLKKLRFPTKG
jgi:hypothetical protein